MRVGIGYLWALRKVPALAIVAVLGFAMLAIACGDDDDEVPGNDTGSATEPNATQQPGSASRDAESARTGQLTVGDETWTVEPNIQCAIFGGEVVAIAGHAAEDPDVEITLDYDPDSLIQVKAEKSNDFHWSASDDDVSVEIDGSTVRGEGSFYDFNSGETAAGSFEVTC